MAALTVPEEFVALLRVPADSLLSFVTDELDNASGKLGAREKVHGLSERLGVAVGALDQLGWPDEPVEGDAELDSPLADELLARALQYALDDELSEIARDDLKRHLRYIDWLSDQVPEAVPA